MIEESDIKLIKRYIADMEETLKADCDKVIGVLDDDTINDRVKLESLDSSIESMYRSMRRYSKYIKNRLSALIPETEYIRK